MNGQKEYVLNYQSNSFVRMGSFFFGLFVGLFILEGFGKENVTTFEERLAKKVRKSTKFEYLLHFLGLSLILITYSLVALYFGASPFEKPSESSYAYLILVPLTFLIGLTLFMLPSFWQGNSKLTKFLNRVLGWKKWAHLEKISITFYALSPMVIGFFTYSMQSSIYYDFWTVITYLLGDLFITYILSVVITAAIENQLLVLSSWLEVKVFGEESKYSVLVIEE